MMSLAFMNDEVALFHEGMTQHASPFFRHVSDRLSSDHVVAVPTMESPAVGLSVTKI